MCTDHPDEAQHNPGVWAEPLMIKPLRHSTLPPIAPSRHIPVQCLHASVCTRQRLPLMTVTSVIALEMMIAAVLGSFLRPIPCPKAPSTHVSRMMPAGACTSHPSIPAQHGRILLWSLAKGACQMLALHAASVVIQVSAARFSSPPLWRSCPHVRSYSHDFRVTLACPCASRSWAR